MIHHYPLQWPVGWPRYEGSRKSGNFQVPYSQAERELGRALEKLGASSAYISSDQELRMDGTPSTKPASGPGVAVYFVIDEKQLCVPCDRFNTPRDNLRAIGLTLAMFAAMDRYGTSQMIEATLSGFAALPANASASSTGPRMWWDVLQVAPDADPSVVKAAYRNLAARYHPDAATADHEKFLEVQKAYQESQQ
jgi:hypothetical protein